MIIKFPQIIKQYDLEKHALSLLHNYRYEWHQIYYFFKRRTRGKVWVDGNIKSRPQAFIKRLSTGLKNLFEKGKRHILLHVGS